MTPYYEDEYATIYHGDCREILPTLEPVDLVLTDPPYGIGYKSGWKTSDRSGTPRKNAPSFGADVFDATWMGLCNIANNTIWFLFTRWDVAHRWVAAMEDIGARVCQRLVWDKKHWKMGDLRYYGSQTEDILMLRHGSPDMPGSRSGNLFSFSSSFLPEGQVDHPTQKPVRLVSRLLADCGDSTVLDPFMGSGTTLVAAKQLNRKSIGIEIEEKYCEIAAERLSQGVLALEASKK